MNLRNNLYILGLLTATVLSFSACGDDDDNADGNTPASEINANANSSLSDRAALRLEMPRLKDEAKDSSFLIVYRATDNTAYDKDQVNFCVEWCYKKGIRSQRWSAYQLHGGYGGSYNRVTSDDNKYPFDYTHLPKGSNYYWDQDYMWGSGFQHGHICPNADRMYSHDANYQTFYLTNMQPQYGQFNGYQGSETGLWLRMENLVRGCWSSKSNDTLYVCKGGTIDAEADILTRVKGNLVVPKYFFMALLLKRTTNGQATYRSIGWLAPQDQQYHTDVKLSTYAMSIDQLEQRTGIDFFCNLPDQIETEVESQTGVLFWGFDNY